MALASYSDLKAAVGQWLHRADLAPQIPDFIALAEIRLARDLRISPLIALATVTIAPQGTSGPLPTGFMEVVSARIVSELRYLPPDAYQRALANSNSVTTPLNYTIQGQTFYVAPAWGTGGQVALAYFRKETALSDGNVSNWYLGNAPDALLYACLLEGAPYMRDAGNTQLWQQQYDAALARLNAQYSALGKTA